jgi:hypothetical protein
MKRAALWTGVALGGAALAWQALPAIQNAIAPSSPKATAPKAAPKADEAPKPAALSSKAETPMAERVATLGFLNKRNSQSRDLKMKPGEGLRIGDIVIKLSACEKTASWEQEQWTGAFIQVITKQSQDKWQPIFSGWTYKESPSLNVVEHPIYDVWVKECEMRHQDIGEDTIVTRADEPSRAGKADDAE